MLDQNCALLLRAIRKECGDGAFKIFTTDDLLAELPAKHTIAPEVIAEMIRFLEEREYVQVKYRDSDSYCLTVLSKGRLYEENVTEHKRERRSLTRFVIVSFLAGFLGAFCGVLLAAVLLHLI